MQDARSADIEVAEACCMLVGINAVPTRFYADEVNMLIITEGVE